MEDNQHGRYTMDEIKIVNSYIKERIEPNLNAKVEQNSRGRTFHATVTNAPDVETCLTLLDQLWTGIMKQYGNRQEGS